MSDTNSVDDQVLHNILTNLVTVPEDVKIEREIDEQGVLLSIIVNPKDMGIVIGRNGSMANSIKTIMRAVGKANKMNVRIQFLEPDGSVRYAAKNNSEGYSGNSHSAQSHHQDNYSQGQVHIEASEAAPAHSQAISLDDDLKDFVVN